MKFKSLYLLAIAGVFALSCNNTNTKEIENTETQVELKEIAYQTFGDTITDKDVITKDEMLAKYQDLKPGDTIDVKFTAKVNEVCQSKGCWMQMDLGEEEAMVKFKDYAFFMPKDIAGEEIIVSGKAFVNEMSVDEQRHYAEDAGKSEEEIAAITEPKRTLSFTSNGVLIAQKE
ncbi:DUF4920 domain-containing protein [Jejudonia soesokkakensis]|uniref:DUF4920 domain-containing protein n=1 Tax=Jejudonia soesokkakensis TaxID=1323432 RepID=A0ABW2MW32_9FLAO